MLKKSILASVFLIAGIFSLISYVRSPTPTDANPMPIAPISVIPSPVAMPPPEPPTPEPPPPDTDQSVAVGEPPPDSLSDPPSGPAVTRQSIILSQKDYPELTYYLMDLPTDPMYPQWYHAPIEAVQAWALPSSAVTVAVIDSGFALSHEDLNQSWATNSGEIGTTTSGTPCWNGSPRNKQTNNCDDDANGFVDDWRGWDFYHDDNAPQAGQDPITTSASHGTTVSGFIAAAWNNKGVPGINPKAKVMPLQGLSDGGTGSTSDIVRAIEYAVDMGVSVINLSLGGNGHDEAMEAAIDYAAAHGIPVVVASGNCASSPSQPACVGLAAPGYMTYPALYENSIAVGATTSTDSRAAFSGYGPGLELVAPGSNLPYTTSWSTSNQTTLYANGLYGTSYSAPLVSGVVGMMRAQDVSLTLPEIRSMLSESADILPAMNGQNRTNEYGYGRLNAYKAVMLARTKASALAANNNRSYSRNDAPVVQPGFGSNASRPAKRNERLRLLCATSPGSSCSLELTHQTTGEKRQVGTDKSDTEGLVWWSVSDLPVGTWDVVAHTNNAASTKKTLIVQ